MSALWVALLGIMTGVIARLVAAARKGPFGFLLTATLGLVGAFAAAAVGEEGGWYNRGDPITIVAGLFGAILTLVVWALCFKSRRPTSSIRTSLGRSGATGVADPLNRSMTVAL
jgi:uncharacterized membrane protein YeaQ/YmgE (transglycosylase-associated protein family)